MIGNDIIDLAASRKESNWHRPRFLDKLFTERERVLIEGSKHPETAIWLLWSMKESAYKAWMQQGGQRFYGPKRIKCQLAADQNIEAINGSAKIENVTFYTQSGITKQYIYTLSSKQKIHSAQAVNTQLFKIDSAPLKAISQLLYDQLIAAYARQERLSLQDLTIEKTASGIPFLKHKAKRIDLNFSLTHHGDYGAFAWLS